MWTVGLDPGLTETGLVLLNDEGYYTEGVTISAAKVGPDLERIVNLADSIRGIIGTWIFDHKIQTLLIGIEYPIMRGKGSGFAVTTYQIGRAHV